MPIWSKTNIPARISLNVEGWVLVDTAGDRIDWPALPSAEIARKELRLFRRAFCALRDAERSEAFGMRHMQAINE